MKDLTLPLGPFQCVWRRSLPWRRGLPGAGDEAPTIRVFHLQFGDASFCLADNPPNSLLGDHTISFLVTSNSVTESRPSATEIQTASTSAVELHRNSVVKFQGLCERFYTTVYNSSDDGLQSSLQQLKKTLGDRLLLGPPVYKWLLGDSTVASVSEKWRPQNQVLEDRSISYDPRKCPAQPDRLMLFWKARRTRARLCYGTIHFRPFCDGEQDKMALFKSIATKFIAPCRPEQEASSPREQKQS